MWKLSLFLLLIPIAFRPLDAICGVCNENNGVACVGKNEFQICVNNKPVKSLNFTCHEANDICTPFGKICVSPSDTNLKADCGDGSKCADCSDKTDVQFTCTSRNTFTRCSGRMLSEERGVCPEGLRCDPTNHDLPCEDAYLLESKLVEICDREVAIDEPCRF